LTNLLFGLGRLNYLSYLRLFLAVSDLSEIVAKKIMKMIWDLKALNNVFLSLDVQNKKKQAKEYLESGFKQLNKRILARFRDK